jgi:hypothetical protein
MLCYFNISHINIDSIAAEVLAKSTFVSSKYHQNYHLDVILAAKHF